MTGLQMVSIRVAFLCAKNGKRMGTRTGIPRVQALLYAKRMGFTLGQAAPVVNDTQYNPIRI